MLKSFPASLTLETERCRLRHIKLADLPHIFEATRTPGFNDGMLWDPPDSAEDLLVPHQRNVAAWLSGAGYTFTAEAKADGVLIGRIAIREQQHGVADIGYWIHPRQQRKGYGKEIAARVVKFGFEELELERILANHAVWNTASRKILEHVGMRFVAHIPQGYKKRDEWVAEDRLELTREQWEAMKANVNSGCEEAGD